MKPFTMNFLYKLLCTFLCRIEGLHDAGFEMSDFEFPEKEFSVQCLLFGKV
jgi:hypothetical protein